MINCFSHISTEEHARRYSENLTSVHMLKNVNKTHFFNFVANGFIRLCWGWGGGGGEDCTGWQGWYRNISLLPVLCTDSLNSLVEALCTQKAPPFHQSWHLCCHNLMICSYPRESCAFQTHLQWGWRCFSLLLAPHTVALTKCPTSRLRFCWQSAQQSGKVCFLCHYCHPCSLWKVCLSFVAPKSFCYLQQVLVTWLLPCCVDAAGRRWVQSPGTSPWEFLWICWLLTKADYCPWGLSSVMLPLLLFWAQKEEKKFCLTRLATGKFDCISGIP